MNCIGCSSRICNSFVGICQLFFCFLSSCDVNCQQLGVGFSSGSTKVAVRGDSTSFSCVAQGQTSTMKLYKVNGATLREVVNSPPAFIVTVPFAAGLTTALIFSITSVESSDAGVYSCQATTSSASGSGNITLVVDVRPSQNFVTVVESPKGGKLQEGDSFSLNCSVSLEVSPAPNVTWIHQGKDVASTKGGFESIFSVGKVSLAQGGKYECVVENEHGNAIKEFLIDVQAPANITKFTNSSNGSASFINTVDVFEGTNETLECVATGDPAPVVKILHEGKSLVEGSLSAQIQLTNVKVSDDNGTYVCNASNEVGSDVKQVDVIVYEIPVIVFFNSTSHSLTGVSNASCIPKTETATLKCESSGHPNPDVTLVGPDRKQLASGLGLLDYSFPADVNLMGTYTCQAMTKYHTAEKTFYVCISREPDAPFGLSVSDGGTGQLLFTWTAPFDGFSVITSYGFSCVGSASPSVRRTVDPPVDQQTVAESSFQQSVEYTCTVNATNAIGTSSSSQPFVMKAPDNSPGIPNVKSGSLKARSVSIQWTAVPLSNRNGIIRSYIVYIVCKTGAICPSTPQRNYTSTNLEYSINGLHPSTTYEVGVSAVNVIGESPSSLKQTVKTTADVPSISPPGVIVTPGTITSTSFTVVWQKIPVNQENAPVTDYTVYVMCEGNRACVSPVPSKTIKPPTVIAAFTNLTPYTKYEISVSATNEGGEGPKTDPPIQIETKQGVPSVIQNLKAISVNGVETSVNVSWNEPLTLNGKLGDYQLTYLPNIDPINVTETYRVVDSLNDEEYTFEVRAVTGAGPGPSANATGRPFVSPKASGPGTVVLEYKGTKPLDCLFRSYPAKPVPIIKKSGVTLTQALVTDNPSGMPISQRLTYTTSQVGSYSCILDNKKSTFQVIAQAGFINFNQTKVALVGSSVSVVFEARQYPEAPKISCAMETSDSLSEEKRSSFDESDGANYERLTVAVSKAGTLTCSITGSAVSVTIEVTTEKESFSGVSFATFAATISCLVLTIVVLSVALAYLVVKAKKSSTNGFQQKELHYSDVELKAPPVYDEIAVKEKPLKSSEFTEERVTSNPAYAALKIRPGQQQRESLNDPSFSTVSQL